MPCERRQAQALVRRRLLWNAALPLKPPPHALVSDIDRLAEHERAAPNNAVDAARVTLADGLVCNAPVPKGPMEPHSAYALVV
jgi:hypothetical protein